MRIALAPPSHPDQLLQPRRAALRASLTMAATSVMLAGSACDGGASPGGASPGGAETGGTTSSDVPRVLLPLRELTPTAADGDPLFAHRPSSIECSNLSGWYRERDVLEVDTGHCNYFSVTEPAATTAKEGDELVLELSHYDLTSPEPAEAHFAIWVDERVIAEETWDIPREASVEQITVPLTLEIPEGTPVGLHLHNHGQNSWQLSPILVR